MSRVEALCLIATIVLLIFAAVAALVSMPTRSGAAPEVPHARAAGVIEPRAASRLNHPVLPAHRVGDRVLQHVSDAGLLGVVLDRTDPTLLHVVVAHGVRPVDCNVIRPDVSVIVQNATAVRIVVSGYEYLPASVARAGLGGTTCVTSTSTAVPVRLASALGARRVYDDRSPVSMAVGPG